MNTGKRTLAFQVSEEFYQAVQDHIKERKIKLKDFGIAAIQRMLDESAPADPEATDAPEQE